MIAIGSDHAGYQLKAAIIKFLIKNKYDVKDFGTSDGASVDYPDYGLTVAKAVRSGECEKGILICGTGIGISIAANKVPGIRAAVCTNSYMAKASREHNNANILALGERVTGLDLALEIVDLWLKTEAQKGRHQARLTKIAAIEAEFNIK